MFADLDGKHSMTLHTLINRTMEAIDYFCFYFCIFEFIVQQYGGDALRNPFALYKLAGGLIKLLGKVI